MILFLKKLFLERKLYKKPDYKTRDYDFIAKQIIRIAQHESELELGVNPSDFEQADTGYLSENDFDYLNKIQKLVDKRLVDLDWLAITTDRIEGKKDLFNRPLRGVKFDDELFKSGRGILEAYLNNKYNKK